MISNTCWIAGKVLLTVGITLQAGFFGETPSEVGTPQYSAPEVWVLGKAAEGYDQRVDLWSLGVATQSKLGATPG